MEYTKDIILKMGCQKGVLKTKGKEYLKRILDIIKNNKIIVTIFFSLIGLIIIDIALVNYFLDLLTKLY